MFPPAVDILPTLVAPLLETLKMALLGSTFPVPFALMLAILSASNTCSSSILGASARTILNVLRTVPDVLWALFIVSAVGLGPVPGVIALTLHSIGGLGKLYYEAIEGAGLEVVEGLSATGASRFQVIWYGILPVSLPLIISSTLLYWEFNNRAATVLGLVGAGGIGLALTHAFQDFRYPEALTAVILILLTLSIIDRISASLRRRVV